MHPLLARLAFLSLAVSIASYNINRIVPSPYLDEVFHIPQAQAYCRDAFHVWDPKLTTPAGLYLLSYPLSYAGACTPAALRAVNAAGVAVVLPVIVYRLQQTIRGTASNEAAAQTALNVALFPLLFFFGGLYYTDVWSAIFVLAAYLATLRRRLWVAAAYAWVSLWFRQTNVVWVVFMAGTATVNRLRAAETLGAAKIHDPLLASSALSDLLATPLSLLLAALSRPLTLLSAVAPFTLPLCSFALFLLYNNLTIVLGDASAHVASLHLPQLLYFTAATSFFSYPLLLPLLPRLRVPPLPTILFLGACTLGAAAAVHHNTVLHPYLLADNRHYTFYVFRKLLLRFPPYTLLAPVPAYIASAYLQLRALNTVTVSWVLLYIAATAATLVGAPLVEPRYFVVAWTLWRVHVAERRRWVLAAEMVWFLLVNVLTVAMFLHRPFRWPQEEEEGWQRFMW